VTIHYAVEIITDATDITDVNYGCVNGIFRFITDRPGYDGEGPVFPVYEDDSDNTNVWYEGWLIKDGLGNPSRQVNITMSGEYGTLSGFSFALHNTTKFWNFCKDNFIYLTNRAVKLYVVLGDKFYQSWTGVIAEYPYNDSQQTFSCEDKFRTIHKQIPPTVISKTAYDDASESADGETIPVLIGEVQYAKVMSLAGISTTSQKIVFAVNPFTNRSEYHTSAAAWKYWISDGSPQYGGAPAGTIGLELITNGLRFPENAFKDLYLRVIIGEGADPEVLTRITYSSETNYGVLWNYTTIYLAEQLPVTPDAFNGDGTTSTEMEQYAYIFSAGTGSNPVKIGGTSKTWWFEVVDASVECVVSEGAVGELIKDSSNRVQLFTYNDVSKTYKDASDIVETITTSSDGRTVIKIVSDVITTSGDIKLLSYIPTTTENGYFCDRIRKHEHSSQAYYFNNTDGSGRISIPLEISNVNPDEYDEMYITADINFTPDVGQTKQWRDFYIEYSFTDIYNYKLKDTIDVGGEYKVGTDTGATATPVSFNFIPNSVYRNGGDTNDEGSLFGTTYEDDSGSLKNASDIFKMPDAIKEMLRSRNIIKKVYCELTFLQTTIPAYPNGIRSFFITVKELAVVGLKVINTLNGDLYTKVKGEPLLDGSNSNTVYRAFKHILESYDGIPSSDIDYSNLPTMRDDWHCGRQILERKSTFDYLNELAKQSYVCIVPKRDGKRLLTSWRDNVDDPTVHNEVVIIRNSIKGMSRTPMSYLYNNFRLRYAWNQASGKFDRVMFIDRIDAPALPSDSDESWKNYVGGLENGSYASSKVLWDTCHASYLKENLLSPQLPTDLSELYWYQDVKLIQPDSGSYQGVDSSAYKYLENLVEWTTRQKETIEYSIPLNETHILLELLDPVIVSDPLITNNVQRTGWVTDITIDTKEDIVNLKLMLEPYDIDTLSSGLIVERGTTLNIDTITETGTNADTVTES